MLKQMKEHDVQSTSQGLIFNIQRFSLHDGPGIRTTFFMKGCPLRCKWCSNPESQSPSPEIMTLDRNCIGCGECARICPQKAIAYGNGRRIIDRDKCDSCLLCAQVCPSGAIQVSGVRRDVERIVAEAEKDEPFYRNSGGGITISGGEPLFQWRFVRRLMKELKTRNFHTVLDTSGCAPWNVMEKVLEYVDLVLYDIKLVDPMRHRAETGFDNEMILSNAGKTASRLPTWIRYPVIPGFNDSESSAREIAEFVSRLPVEKISLLPYHALGAQKYERLGRAYPLGAVSPPDAAKLKLIVSICDSLGMKVSIGY